MNALQKVFQTITPAQADLVWTLVSGYVEDVETYDVEVEPATLAGAIALRDAMDAAVASYAEEAK